MEFPRPTGPVPDAPEPGVPAPGFRLPPETRPGRVRLQVAELERSLRFYREILGMEILSRVDRGATLGAGGGGYALVELHERPGAEAVPPGGRLGLFHFAILLPDRAELGRLLDHLEGRGIRPGASDHRVSEALYLHDPDGLGIEVYADRPRSSWRVQGRELLMDTAPLDRADLVRAGAGASWSGLPAGSTMGHLHLHVGTLPEADAFYHDALGLDRMVWSYPGALFLGAGGYHHHLGVNTWAPPRPATEAHARLLDWELLVPDPAVLDDAGRSLTEHRYEAVPAADDGLRVADPWGTVLRLRAIAA